MQYHLTASVSGCVVAGASQPTRVLSLAAALRTTCRIDHHCIWGPARGGRLVPSLCGVDPDTTDPSDGVCCILTELHRIHLTSWMDTLDIYYGCALYHSTPACVIVVLNLLIFIFY